MKPKWEKYKHLAEFITHSNTQKMLIIIIIINFNIFIMTIIIIFKLHWDYLFICLFLD